MALLVWGAPPASAGGPTSVLVVSPASEETASLYYDDKEYTQLERLLGNPVTGSRSKPPEADLASARRFTVTWMVHDISPWRLDQIFSMHEGREIWIHTAANLPRSVNGSWHRAERSEELSALLKELGVMGRASDDPGFTDIMSAPWATEKAEATAPEPAVTVRAQAPAVDDGTDWWWVLPGATGGAVLALALRSFAARTPFLRRGRAGEPKRELLDA
jgi:hypothetical protein